MKILFVGRNCRVGGGCTFRYRASLGLIAEGHEVHLAAQSGPMAPRFKAAGVHFHRVPPTPFNRLKLWALCRRERFDMVHACNSTAGDDVAWVSRRMGSKLAWVMSVHGNLPPHVTGNRCLREAREVMTFDQSAVDRLHLIPWMRERSIHLVPRPIERRPLPVEPLEPPQITMVSRLSSTKATGAIAAIDAVEALQGEFPGLSVKIVGDGSRRAEVQARCEAANLQAGQTATTAGASGEGRQIAIAPGAQTDPFAAMAGSRVVVGTSYVAFEALYHEIPVVAAGYEGYGLVTSENLEDAIACNFGDGLPGLHPVITSEFLTNHFRGALTRFSTRQGKSELRQMRDRLERDHSLEAVARRLEGIYGLALGQAGVGVSSTESPSSVALPQSVP